MAAKDYARHYRDTDFRAHPERYRVGKGEQGVLLAEPYKSELLPHWRFRTPEVAQESAEKLYACYLEYKRQGDFVGMDMARKFLQMGYTRALRYARHRSGRKYAKAAGGEANPKGPELPLEPDPVKAQSAAIFQSYYLKVVEDPEYLRLRQQHVTQHERTV